jgi:hypothetical protein
MDFPSSLSNIILSGIAVFAKAHASYMKLCEIDQGKNYSLSLSLT